MTLVFSGPPASATPMVLYAIPSSVDDERVLQGVARRDYAAKRLTSQLWEIAIDGPLDRESLILDTLAAQTSYTECLLKLSSCESPASDCSDSDSDSDSDSGSDSDSDSDSVVSPEDCEAALEADLDEALRRAGVERPVPGGPSADVSACLAEMPLGQWPAFLELYLLRESSTESPESSNTALVTALTDAMQALGAGEACFSLWDRAFSEGCCGCSVSGCCTCLADVGTPCPF